MAFTVLNTIALERFSRKFRDARIPLADWLDTVTQATWESLTDVRRIYPAADGVAVRVAGGDVVVVTVFNIRGNRYRLLAVIHYATAVCRVLGILTHAQYSTNRWKDRL
jgi:mRNA interferase HigB